VGIKGCCAGAIMLMRAFGGGCVEEKGLRRSRKSMVGVVYSSKSWVFFILVED